MRGATRAKWGVCAVGVALVATACGGGAGAGRSGVVSSSWGDPQNPLEPANTNEVQGGKVLEMLFRGLKRYDPKTGAAENVIADRIETSDSQNFTVTLKPGWTFSNGEKVTAKSFVDAWNYGALLSNKQKNAAFFQYIDGFAQVHPDGGSPRAKTLSGLVVKDEGTFTVKLNQKFSSWPDTLGYSAFMPLPQAFFRITMPGSESPWGTGRISWIPTRRGPCCGCGSGGSIRVTIRPGTAASICGSTRTTTPPIPISRPATSIWSTTFRPRSSSM